MQMQEQERRGPLGFIASWMSNWQFPTVAITFVLAFALLTLVVTFVPATPTGFGAFAEAFRVWCFGWNNTQSFVPVILMCSELLVFALIVWLIWGTPLRDAFRLQRRRMLITVGGSSAAVVGAVGALVALGTPEPAVFQLEAIRTSVPAPPLRLVDQAGDTIDLADLGGKVVMVTAVYATCGNTCPMMLGAIRRTTAALSEAERADLRIIAITLDPANDTPEALEAIAFHQGVERPLWLLVSGDVQAVENTLDRWNVARTRDPATGRIDHANVFMLIDRNGRLSFRLGLADAEGERLLEALRLLIDERRTP